MKKFILKQNINYNLNHHKLQHGVIFESIRDFECKMIISKMSISLLRPLKFRFKDNIR